MQPSSHEEREVRAARNQALFRVVNEEIEKVNRALASINDMRAIACECADPACVDTIRISPAEYEAVRAEPRHFAVLPGHVYLDVERVVQESERYSVVEKFGAAGELAESLAASERAAAG